MLVEPLSEEQLNRVYTPILSPLAWDLGHIGNFEELWLVQRVGGREPLRGELGRFYDAIENPRSVRNELPILRGETLLAYMADVRERMGRAARRFAVERLSWASVLAELPAIVGIERGAARDAA